LQNEIGSLLSDHDRRRIDIAAYQMRHYRRINDAEAFDAANPESRVDDGGTVYAHLAGAARVKDRNALRAEILFPIVPGGHRRTRGQFRTNVSGKWRGGKDPTDHLATADQDIHIALVVQEASFDSWRIARIR
jgi:hypothetical protein